MLEHKPHQRHAKPKKVPGIGWTIQVKRQQEGTHDIPVEEGELVHVDTKSGNDWEARITKVLEVKEIHGHETAICQSEYITPRRQPGAWMPFSKDNRMSKIADEVMKRHSKLQEQENASQSAHTTK